MCGTDSVPMDVLDCAPKNPLLRRFIFEFDARERIITCIHIAATIV